MQAQKRHFPLLRTKISRVSERLADQAAPYQDLAAVLQLQQDRPAQEPLPRRALRAQQLLKPAQVAGPDRLAKRDEVGSQVGGFWPREEILS